MSKYITKEIQKAEIDEMEDIKYFYEDTRDFAKKHLGDNYYESEYKIKAKSLFPEINPEEKLYVLREFYTEDISRRILVVGIDQSEPTYAIYQELKYTEKNIPKAYIATNCTLKRQIKEQQGIRKISYYFEEKNERGKSLIANINPTLKDNFGYQFIEKWFSENKPVYLFYKPNSNTLKYQYHLTVENDEIPIEIKGVQNSDQAILAKLTELFTV